ncbi:SH3 domain-containing protein [Allosphingosinicella sp.]|jgi:SH3-like domain-containing protein|uniref:SH3 domain-containing protein n=1 Tax=Allosphingosinicella sp. TaxID=2823234 RepID=UPI002EFC7EC3
MVKRLILGTLLAASALVQSGAQAQRERQPPYWASLAANRAMMRTGPAQTYPGVWLYVRSDLPVRVVGVQPSWRKVQDPDGATGWMMVRLLSDTRTALVTGEEPRPIHDEPDEGARIRYRAEPGVVGRLSRCASGWCRLDVGHRGGFIRTEHIWGVAPNEEVE